MSTKEFDMIIIGSGAALIVMEAALNSGLSCALIENSKFGGTCLTKGCIPSKILTTPADIIMEMRHAKKIGLDIELKAVDWDVITARVWKSIDKSKKLESNLSKIENLTVFKGTGEFTGPKTMRVLLADGTYSEEFSGKRVVIGAGARSSIPPIEGLDEAGYVTSETFFGEKFPAKLYKSLTIVGAGAVGAEFAHIFNAYGSKVTIVEYAPRLVAKEEEEISTQLETEFKHAGIDVFAGYKAVSVTESEQGKTVTLENVASGETTTVTSEELFIASGVRSNADLLKAELSGIATDEKGWIKTDEYLRTSVENIWALGDINGKYQLRHKANYEAEILVKNFTSPPKEWQKADYTRVPWAIYTYPQIARVGMTQAEAQANGQGVFVGKKYFSSVAKGGAMGFNRGDFDDGFVKLIADKDKKILGVHIIGPHADILVQAFVYLMNAGYSCEYADKKQCAKMQKLNEVFRVNGSFVPIFKSIVIHPSLNELTAWVLGELEWTELGGQSHTHTHTHEAN